jgi:predicted PurR-regulated permease PerM
MLRGALGGAVLALLSVFFAYLLAPMVVAVRRRIRVGRRQRPISGPAAIVLIYVVTFVPALLVWRWKADTMRQFVNVTAPAAVERLFSGDGIEPLGPAIERMPIGARGRRLLHSSSRSAGSYLEREARETLDDLIAAAPAARWLAVAPVLAFVLLTGAPGFQRSTLRVLPHGHVQWRAEEYFRDVNSALAGYVRAQSAAAIVVGILCVAGFLLIGVPSAVSLGVAAGVLELVPAIGPLTALLIACSQAGDRIVAIVVFLAALRVLQDYLIYPRLVRRGMHLSTPAVIGTIWVGAVLGGAAGVILAIPVAGFLSVSLRHLREYREIEQLVRRSAEIRSAEASRSTRNPLG